MKLLIIDDDAELCALLQEFLQREGFSADCAHEGNGGLAQALEGGYDLIVLDVMLPGIDGFEILKRLRATSRVPVIMLTARGEDVDRIVGLELGADDYLPKPFNPRELVARVKAILRRTEPKVNRGRVEVNGVALDPGTREVVCEGKPIEVTTLEFDILEQLMRNAGHVVSRDGLMESLYNRKATPFDRSIDMHVSHLRRKLEGARPVIKTIRGVGYQFCQSPESPVLDGHAEDGLPGMRSLFAKTLLWFLATTAVAIGGIILTTALSVGSPEGRGPFGMLLNVQVAEAKRAYETGGRDALSAVLSKFQQITEQKVIFTDAKGTDLLTGQAHPDLVRRPPRRSRWRLPFPFNTGRPPVIARPDSSRQYWLFLINQRSDFRFYFLQPQHLWIIGLVVLLCYGFAYHLTSPVRRLRAVVDCFGHGDFSARAATNRKDELGQLAKSFNLMADRIQTLLAAEHRLLLDISHELRSPLARLGVAIELARSGEDREHMLDRIQKEADRINELVAELLQVTRVEGDPTALKNMTVRLDELLADLVYDSLLEAKSKDCTLLLDAPVSVALNGDEELIRRAIENVIRNAIRYAPRGTAVEIALNKVAGGARISVRDQGPGVPEESLPRIFDPFYRVDSDRNRSSGGLGLGLAIARRAVELHSGHLKASNANPGLLVTIELPLPAESPVPVAATTARPTPVSTS